MSKRTILAVAVLWVLLAIPLFTVSADPPDIFIEPLNDYWDIPCGDFYVRDAWTGEARFIVQKWDPPRGSIHYSTLDYFYRIDASGNPVGEMYLAHIHSVSVVRHPDHGWMDLGANIHTVIPGAGSVFIDAGRVYWDEAGNFSYQGNHQWLDMDLERFCAAFAQ